MIRYQDALLTAQEEDSAPYIPMGRRGRYKMAMMRLRNRQKSYR